MTKQSLLIVSVICFIVGSILLASGFSNSNNTLIILGMIIWVLLLILIFNWESKLKREEERQVWND